MLTLVKIMKLTHMPLKTYQPNSVLNQWVSMDMIQSHESVDEKTANTTKNTAPLLYCL